MFHASAKRDDVGCLPMIGARSHDILDSTCIPARVFCLHVCNAKEL